MYFQCPVTKNVYNSKLRIERFIFFWIKYTSTKTAHHSSSPSIFNRIQIRTSHTGHCQAYPLPSTTVKSKISKGSMCPGDPLAFRAWSHITSIENLILSPSYHLDVGNKCNTRRYNSSTIQNQTSLHMKSKPKCKRLLHSLAWLNNNWKSLLRRTHSLIPLRPFSCLFPNLEGDLIFF